MSLIILNWDGYTEWLLDSMIRTVNNPNSGLDIKYETLFRFIVDNPETETAKDFVRYHYEDMGDPCIADGGACFTYLINEPFNTDFWVAEKDKKKFLKMLLAVDEVAAELDYDKVEKAGYKIIN